jgi:hypothetical protein
MTPTEARERAKAAFQDIERGSGYCYRLWDAAARLMLLAQAEAYEDAHEVRFACGDDGFSEYLARKAAALRAAAEEIE